ncbi:MAG: DUF4190 domain-containing protein, partial [Planctomycetaceae bacterium]|nr:DUF4190 domain-containing protein [Planctomycetaceae bacterium]
QEFDQSLSTVSKEEIGSTGITVGYRAISVLAVVAFIFSLFTPLMFLSNWFVICPLLGAVCGLFGLYRILSCPFDYTGRNFALAGIICSLVLALGAAGWGIRNYYFSIPYGYTAVNFLDLRPDPKTNKLPEYILDIAKEHRKVYLRGYMYPGRQLAGIENFMLVRTVAHCKFCSPEQNPFDMISVHCVGDLKVPYRTRAVHIGGELYVNPKFRYGELPYHIEADIFR